MLTCRSGCAAAEAVQYVVLDEADKMLELGMQEQLTRIRQAVLPQARLSRKLAAATGGQHVQARSC